MADITGGHSLEEYYCAHITSIHKVPTKDRITIDAKNLLQPKLSGKPNAMVTKKLSGEFSCALMMKGSFLQIQMSADLNDFVDLPFTSSSHPTVVTVCILFLISIINRAPKVFTFGTCH